MGKLVRGVMMIGVGVAIGANWARIRDGVLPRITGTSVDPWEGPTAPGSAA